MSEDEDNSDNETEKDDSEAPLTIHPSIQKAVSDFKKTMDPNLRDLVTFFDSAFIADGDKGYANVSQRHRQRMRQHNLDLDGQVDMYGLASSNEVVQRPALDNAVGFIEVTEGREPKIHLVCKIEMIARYDASPYWKRADTSIILDESESSFRAAEQSYGRAATPNDPDDTDVAEILAKLKTNMAIVNCFEKGIVGETTYTPALNWNMSNIKDEKVKANFKNHVVYYMYISKYKRANIGDAQRVKQRDAKEAINPLFAKSKEKNAWLSLARDMFAQNPVLSR